MGKNVAVSVFSWTANVKVSSEIGSRASTLKPLKLDHIICGCIRSLRISIYMIHRLRNKTPYAF